VFRDGPATAVVSGNNGMGHVVGVRCMEMAIEKARRLGLGMVAARDSNHYGIAGYFALMAAKAGMIGVTGTNARPSVAPTFGVENMMGTNPLTIGLPTDEDFPFVIDCATSVAQRGTVEHYSRIGKKMPEGWVIDAAGRPIVDPDEALAGFDAGTCALVALGGMGEVFGGHKGYGYAAAVEILSSALQSGAFLTALGGVGPDGGKRPNGLGHFFIAVDVAAFADPAEFRRTAGDILRALRASAKAPGEGRIYTAGEKEHLAFLERRELGVPVGEALAGSLTAARDELKVDFRFAWE